LVPTNESRNPWYTEENMQKQRASQFRDKLEHTAASKRVKAFQKETVRDFKKTFSNLNNREPMDEEIVGNLEDVIDPNVVRDILRREATAAIELGSLSSSSTEGGLLSSV
jgi:Mg/Co/Ni transporter MgtE